MIIFLQNAWSPVHAGKVWPRRSWLRALARSRSGQRLRLLTEDWESFHNTTPLTGATASSKLAPDYNHVVAVLNKFDADVVVACGLQAEAVLKRVWRGPLMCVPHPAHRYLTNALYEQARQELQAGFTEQFALRQRRNGVEKVPFERSDA